MSAGMDIEWERVGTLTVLTTAEEEVVDDEEVAITGLREMVGGDTDEDEDDEAVRRAAEEFGTLTVRLAGRKEETLETPPRFSSQLFMLGNRSSSSILTLQSSSWGELFPTTPFASVPMRPPASEDVGGSRRGCCCDRSCRGATCCVGFSGRDGSSGFRMESLGEGDEDGCCCSNLIMELTSTSEDSGDDVVGMLPSK